MESVLNFFIKNFLELSIFFGVIVMQNKSISNLPYDYVFFFRFSSYRAILDIPSELNYWLGVYVSSILKDFLQI